MVLDVGSIPYGDRVHLPTQGCDPPPQVRSHGKPGLPDWLMAIRPSTLFRSPTELKAGSRVDVLGKVPNPEFFTGSSAIQSLVHLRLDGGEWAYEVFSS
jgi:hypothetical protein